MKNRGQEEMVGFALIIIIVAVVLVVFLSFSLGDKESELESCVIPGCRKILNIKKNTPIDLRRFYVEGVGQLCEDCYNRIYNIENA